MMNYWASTKRRDLENGLILAFTTIVVACLMLGGVLFLYEGLGLHFRILDYPGLRPYAIPIGLFLLFLGVLIARFWIAGLEKRLEADREGGSPSDTSPRTIRAAQSGRSQAAPADRVEDREPLERQSGLREARDGPEPNSGRTTSGTTRSAWSDKRAA